MSELASLLEPPPLLEDHKEILTREGDGWPLSRSLYRWTASVCLTLAHIRPESPAMRAISELGHAVVSGLLTRCGRLMLANLSLGDGGEFGGSIASLERAVFESSIEVRWIVNNDLELSVKRYVANGMRNEREMRKEVERIVAARGVGTMAIEDRLLSRCEHLLREAGMTDGDLDAFPGWPNLHDMMMSLGYSRIQYVGMQKMASLAVHGRWSSLLAHYIEREGGRWVPREFAPVPVDQWLNILPVVLSTLSAVCSALFRPSDAVVVTDVVERIEREADAVYEMLFATDRELLDSPA